jgi:hypothetical protein
MAVESGETAAELRDMADQMRWAENRDHLLNLAEHFADLADPTNERHERSGTYVSTGK